MDNYKQLLLLDDAAPPESFRKLFNVRAAAIKVIWMCRSAPSPQADPLLDFPITLEAGTGMASKFLPPDELAAVVGSELQPSVLKSYLDVWIWNVQRFIWHSGLL